MVNIHFVLLMQAFLIIFNQYWQLRLVVNRRRKRVQLYRRQRLHRRTLAILEILENATYPRISRRTWRKPRSLHFWKDIVLKTFSEDDWIKNFRMSKVTFEYLYNHLKSVIERQDNRFRRAISVRHRLAITIWTLATPCEYRTIGHLFGVARSTVCVIVHDTCKAIVDRLFSDVVTFPQGSQLTDTICGFETNWQIPQCVGAIDGSHIPVAVPANLHTDYYNRKGWYSILVQAVISYDYTISDVCIGWPGSVHDARVFVHSGIYQKATKGELLNSSTKDISGVQVPPYLIGDAAYPMKTWLMKPFPDRGLSSNERIYNYRLSRARMVVENGFGRLKGRWRRLLKRNDMSLNNIPTIIAACCVLHNICEKNRDRYDDSWNTDVAEMERVIPQPDSSSRENAEDMQPNHATGQEIRRALMQYFVNHPLIHQ